MKLGINLLLWTGNVTEEHVPVMEELKGLGYDGVELPLFSFDKNVYKKLKKHLDRIGLECTGVTCMMEGANPISPDTAERKAGLEQMKKAIAVCDILGANVLCGPFTAPVGGFTGKPRTEEEWKRGLDVMRKSAAAAEKAGVTLALEALNRFETYFLTTAAEAAEFASEVGSPNFGIMWDTFHANIEEESIPKALESVIGQVKHVHISENNRSTPGTGHINFNDTMKVLKKHNYNGWLMIEAFSSALEELAGATKIWRKMFPDNSDLAAKGIKVLRKLAA